MTRKDLADAIHGKLGFSKRESSDIVDYFFDTVKNALKKGDPVKLPRFGSFYVKKTKAKKGRNPVTGEVVDIPPRSKIAFKPSRILRAAANSKPDD